MNGKIIVVAGHLAAGKSTFVVQLSKSLNVPYLVKDTFKIAICTSIPITNRDEGSRFSAVTFDAIMYATERLIEVGYPIIIEGNFMPAGVKKIDEAGAIKALCNKYNCRSLTFKFIGDSQILYKRYIERNRLPERGDANKDFTEPTFDVFDGYCRDLDGFNIGGETIIVDTTDFSKVDFDSHIETARLFINS